MNGKECSELAAKARAFGYATEVKPILGGTYRLYLTKPDGCWTFVVDEDDLADVHADLSLWVTPRDAGLNDAGEQCERDIFNFWGQ